MDIEGGEFDVLISESLAAFSIVVIEFHGLEKMFKSDFLDMLSMIFEKIYQDFSICHVHPNNSSDIIEVNRIQIPPVIEITFIRNDLISRCHSDHKITLPHALDRKNVPERDDIVMPDIWWKS